MRSALRFAYIELQELEGRLLFTTVPLTAVPALDSLPQASVKLYLDFNGDPSNHATLAYDTDGDPTTFSDAELSDTRQIWARVAEKYAPFKIDVTTVDPGSFPDLVALHVLIGGNSGWTGSVSGGTAYVGSFRLSFLSNDVYVFPENLGDVPSYIAEAVAHEAGHAFGLQHQSSYSGTTLTNEYNPGTATTAPIMGVSYYSSRGLWWSGTNDISSTTSQDDMSVIANLSTNGFGYRTDDDGGTVAAAGALSVSGSNLSASGVIERTTDKDYFSFTTSGGLATFNADVGSYVQAQSGSNFGATLDLRLEIRDASNTLIASSDTASLGESLSATLASGTYYLVVASHGNYGDVGTYTLSGSAPALGPTADLGGTYTVAEGGTLSLNGAGSTGPGLTYAWDLDGDGIFGETGGSASRGNETGATPVLSAVGLDGASTYAISLQVTDFNGLTSTVSGSISITNVAPTLTLTGASSTAEGANYTLNFSATDPGQDTISGWVVNWGDGSSTTLGGGSTSSSHIYADNASRTITMTATDEDGSYSTTKAITVTNVNPVAAISSAPASGPEGTAISLTGSATDAGTLDTFTYAWSVTKGGAAYSSGSGSSFSLTPNDNGTYVVTLLVTDKDGGTNSTTATITVTNVAPTASIPGAPPTSPEGSAISLTSLASDPGSLDSFTYAWSVTKNGSAYTSGSGASYSFTPNDNGTYVVTLLVTDKDGGTGSTTATITATNVAPTATNTGAPASSAEGTAISLTGSATDAGALDTFTYAWNVTKAGAAYTSGTGSSFTLTPNDNATYVVTLTVTDKDGGIGTTSRTITVTDVAPTITLSGAASVAEGASYTLTFSAADPGTDTISSWVINWGDGSSSTLAGTATSAAHSFADNGSYTVTATATNEDGSFSNTRGVTLTNVAPTAAITGAPASSAEGTAISLTGSATDPGTLDTFTYAWSVTKGGAAYTSGSGASFSLTPNDNATYVVTLTVTDKDGGIGSTTKTITATNVVPTASIAGAPASSAEGTGISLSGSATDPGTLDTFTYAWSVTKGGVAYSSGTGASFTLTPNDNASYIVTLTVTDKDGGIGTTTRTIAVTNVAPTLTITGDAAVNEGAAYTLSLGAVTDPGTDTVSQFIVHWGDGTSNVYATGGSKTHTFTDDAATRTITVDLVDEEGQYNTVDSLDVAVANVAPTLTISGAATATEGALYTLSLDSSDPGTDTIASWVIDWGDGNLETVTGNPTSITHTYAASATPVTISASATDEDGTYAAGNTLDVTVQPPAINPDTTAPTAVLSAAGVSAAGGTSYTFSVVFSDDQGVLAADLNDSDIVVTGPNGFSQAAHLVSVNNSTDGTPRTAVYSITPPGGSWNYTANGYYSILLNDGAVRDVNGNAAAGAVLGGFKVGAPVPDLGGTTLDTAAYMGIMSPTYNQTFQDYVSKGDRHDYYRVRIKSNMTINSKLYGMTDNVDLQLLDGNGKVLVTAAKAGTVSDNISRAVTPGTYYLHVYYSGSSSTSYYLRISGAAIAAAPAASQPAAAMPSSIFSTASSRDLRKLLMAAEAA